MLIYRPARDTAPAGFLTARVELAGIVARLPVEKRIDYDRLRSAAEIARLLGPGITTKRVLSWRTSGQHGGDGTHVRLRGHRIGQRMYFAYRDVVEYGRAIADADDRGRAQGRNCCDHVEWLARAMALREADEVEGVDDQDASGG